MRIIVTTLAAAAALAALPAAADPISVSIPVSQSDLQSPSGIASLYERIEAAAEEVCRIGNRENFDTRATCVRDVVRQAVARAELTPLSQYRLMAQGHAQEVEIAAR